MPNQYIELISNNTSNAKMHMICIHLCNLYIDLPSFFIPEHLSIHHDIDWQWHDSFSKQQTIYKYSYITPYIDLKCLYKQTGFDSYEIKFIKQHFKNVSLIV